METRPIAGTHPRGKGIKDEAQKDNLISHPKEIAEHVMLLDLERMIWAEYVNTVVYL